MIRLLVVTTLFALVSSAAFAQETSSPLVRANPNWPSDQEARDLLDELFYQRAIHSYILTLRALNTIALRDGSEAAFGKGYNKVTTWHDRMGPKTWAPTPNADIGRMKKAVLKAAAAALWTQQGASGSVALSTAQVNHASAATQLVCAVSVAAPTISIGEAR